MEELHDQEEKARGPRSIRLSKGLVALVDDEDYESLSAYKWYASRIGHTSYAMRHAHTADGRRTTQYMHRMILARKLQRALAKKEQVDHVNGNGIDNRRENLRPVTISQNHRNCWKRKLNTSSRFLGVYWNAGRGHNKWASEIRVAGKRVQSGEYATELDAALAREAYVMAHPELHARLNFPTGDTPTR
jgi:hypothetical protein